MELIWLAPLSRLTGIRLRLATTSRTSLSIGKPRQSPVRHQSDQFELDAGPGCRQIADQGEVFGIRDCKVCPSRTSCTGTTRRSMTLHPREQMQALFAARSRESTENFKDTYRHRAGIEGTHSQAVRTMGLRRSRSIGLHKTHLGHVAIAAAVNLIQLMSWLRGEAPEQTRTSAFKRVMEQAA